MVVLFALIILCHRFSSMHFSEEGLPNPQANIRNGLDIHHPSLSAELLLIASQVLPCFVLCEAPDKPSERNLLLLLRRP